MVADNTQNQAIIFGLAEAKMICNPVPITPMRKQLDYSIDAGGTGVNKITIFKEITKTIKM